MIATTPLIYILLYYLTATISIGVFAVLTLVLAAQLSRFIHSVILSRPCISASKAPSGFRSTVSNHPFDLEALSVVTQNPHAKAARRRSAARNWIHTMIAKLGKRSFAMNLSNSDIRKQIRGNRELRTLKDTCYYNITSDAMPVAGEDIVSIDDLYHTTNAQFNQILRDSHDNDANIFSYTHAPVDLSYTSDEFQIQFDGDRWKFLGPDSAVYHDQLWDTNDEIISHVSLGKFDWKCYVLSFVIVVSCAYLFHIYLVEQLVTPDFSTFRIQLFWYDRTFCYEWLRNTFTYYTHSYFRWYPTFTFGSFQVTSPFSFVIPWIKVNLYIYHTPTFIECPVEHDYILWATVIYAVVLFVPTMYFISIVRMRSGTHFAFRVNCGENRAIWVLHPAASFNLYLTFYHIVELARFLPRRLKPTEIHAPPTDLSPHGSVYFGMQHVFTGKINYSYSLKGTSSSVHLDNAAYTIIRSWNANNKKLLSPSTFTRMYRGGNEEPRDYRTEELLVAIAAVTYATDHTHVVDYERPPNTWNYTMRPHDFPVDQECFSSFQPYFDGPIIGNTYVPINSRANTEQSIEARIRRVAVHLPAPTTKQYNLIREFMTEYRKDASPTIPFTHEEVMERQTKPNQRVTNLEAIQTQPRDCLAVSKILGKITKAFQKTEAAMKPGDPRNITVMPPTVRLENSRYAYALSSNMKKTSWYAFGLTPKEISIRVAEHTSDDRTKSLGLGDYSKMDGSVNGRIREADRAFIRNNLKPEFHAEALEWYEQTFGNKVSAGQGAYYEQGESQASGDPWTSALNTFRNAFVNFCILRQFLSPQGAYKNLGLMAGDDSIQRNVTTDVAKKVAKSWGFTLKIVVAKPGDRIDFLSRIYSPDVWYGSSHNIAAPKRLLSKFHTSKLTTQVDRDVIAYTKARSVHDNDKHTLIIGDYMKKIMFQTRQAYREGVDRLRPNLVKKLEEEKTWASRSHNDDHENGYQWDMKEVHDWQHDVYAEQGFDPNNVDEFLDWLENDDPWNEPPVLLSVEVQQREVPYLANDEIIPALPNPEQPQQVFTPTVTPEVTPVEDGLDHKHAQTQFRCKRGDRNKGWYDGLPPCFNKVDKADRFCPACHKVYMRVQKAKPN